MNINLRSLKLGIVILALTALTACGAKLTQENFDKVKVGMPSKEVKNLIGEPNQIDTISVPLLGSVTRYVYKPEQGQGEVSLLLREDVVQSKIGSIRNTK